MDSTHPTAGWEKVGDRFYRKIQLYTAVFDLDLDLDNFFLAGAPYGGAVGVYPRLWPRFVRLAGWRLFVLRGSRYTDLMQLFTVMRPRSWLIALANHPSPA